LSSTRRIGDKQGAIEKASKVDYELSRFKMAAIEIDEKDMLGLENDPEIEFVDLNLESSVFPPVQNGDFSVAGQDILTEKSPRRKNRSRIVADLLRRCRMAL
jgi:hypothetical protein